MENVAELNELLGKNIRAVSINPLTQAGENYGSTMVAIEATLETDEKLSIIGKLYPKNEVVVKTFNTPVTFKKELKFYSVIVPALEEFQKSYGVEVVDIYPKFYGGRLSLDSKSNDVDKHATILLENLKTAGFVLGDRLKGFDLKTARFIMKKLAVFHASSLAFKLKRPEEFKQKVLPYLNRAIIFYERTEMSVQMQKHIIRCVEKNDPELVDLVRGYVMTKSDQYGPKEVREPFATLGHNDFWVNNMMFRYENDVPVQMKMVDFQVVDYGSPVRDLLFVLFTSLHMSVVESNLDELIDLYYEAFIETLKLFKCHIDDFNRGNFDKELDTEAKYQLCHTLILHFPILTQPQKATKVEDITDEISFHHSNLSDDFEPKLSQVVRQYFKRGWL